MCNVREKVQAKAAQREAALMSRLIRPREAERATAREAEAGFLPAPRGTCTALTSYTSCDQQARLGSACAGGWEGLKIHVSSRSSTATPEEASLELQVLERELA